jgi:hypothetical protein
MKAGPLFASTGRSRILIGFNALLILLQLYLVPAARAQEPAITAYQASTTLAGWPLANAFDNNNSSVWSSVTHPTGTSMEWIAYWFSGFNNINYVRLRPRFNGANQALGFPVTFTIYYSNGSQWIARRTVTSMQRPYRNADMILTFPTANCNGIHIVCHHPGVRTSKRFATSRA